MSIPKYDSYEETVQPENEYYNYDNEIDEEIKQKTLELIEEQIEDTITHEKLCRNLNATLVFASTITIIILIFKLLILFGVFAN